MPTEHTMKATLQEYIRAFNAGDAATVVSLFAEHATVEDPVGGPLKDRRALSEFFYRSSASGAKMTLAAPISGSHSNAAAVALLVETMKNDHRVQIQVIDVMTFDEFGKIATMRAYWGPEDLKTL